MIKYLMFKDKYDHVRFMIEDDTKRPRKRLIAKDKIPTEELKKLLEVNNMDLLGGLNVQMIDESDEAQAQLEQEPESKDCVFGDGPGNRRKFLNGKIVRLCEEDWQTKTTGEIVGQLNQLKEQQLA